MEDAKKEFLLDQFNPFLLACAGFAIRKQGFNCKERCYCCSCGAQILAVNQGFGSLNLDVVIIGWPARANKYRAINRGTRLVCHRSGNSNEWQYGFEPGREQSNAGHSAATNECFDYAPS